MGVFGSFPIQAWLAKLSQASPSLSLASQDLFVWLRALLSLARMSSCLVGWLGLHTVTSSLSW
jgi:hypothetical protein